MLKQSSTLTVMLPRVIAIGSLTLGLVTSTLHSQVAGGTIFLGTVVDTTGQPIAAVEVAIDGTSINATTNVDGAFGMVGVPMGTHLITLYGRGFEPRSFRFTLTPNHPDRIDLGQIPLFPAADYVVPVDDRVTVVGTIKDALTESPVTGALIIVDGTVETVSNADGSYRVESLDPGQHLFETRRVGYRPAAFAFVVGGDSLPMAELDVTLEAVPMELEEVVVEGERTIVGLGRLREFYRRRNTEVGGRYLTRTEIERFAPVRTADVLRLVPGVFVSPQEGAGRIQIRNCGSPNIYLDGIFLGSSSGFDLDNLILPEQLEAIEVYTRNVPFELRGPGTVGTCGVVAIWSRYGR